MAGIGHTPSPRGLNLLAVALRTRAATVSELAALALQDEEATRAALAALEAEGYLAVTGESISYREPDIAVADRAGALLAEATALVAALPQLMDNWAVGSAAPHDLVGEVFHGPYAATELWLSYASKRRVRATDGVMPDAARIFGAARERHQTWFEVFGAEDHRVRSIFATADLSHPDAAERIAEDVAVGVEFRMMPRPPSWFWVIDDEIAGLPLQWGEAWPTSVVAVRSEPVVSLLRWLFQRLWEEAVPISGEAAPWDRLLGLMAQGATLETASRALGISSRTGRRRIDAAMDHYGVTGSVALGAAWQRGRPGHPAE